MSSSPPSATATTTATASAPSSVDLSHLSDLSLPPAAAPLDVPAYLNQHYPSEHALLTELPAFLARLHTADSRLSADLSSLIREHRHDTPHVHVLAESTNHALTDLDTTLTHLSQSANAANDALLEALSPAAPLHTALQNVMHTSEVLQALLDLDRVVAVLESAASSSDFSLLDHTPSPFQKLTASLATLDALPQHTVQRLRPLPSLRARATVANETLRTSLLAVYARHSDLITNPPLKPDPAHHQAVSSLALASRVVQAMGPEIRSEVLGAFVRRRRQSFVASFGVDNPGLVTADKRFSWLRRELRTHWSHLGGEREDRGWGRVFPSDWDVARKLTDGIVGEIRDWVVATLKDGADRDVAIMISTLRKTKEFELELDRRFALGPANPVDGSEQVHRSASSSQSSFVGTVSDCFSPWMEAFVRHEDDHIASVLAELVREETWVCQHGTVLKSGTELLLVIKKSMRTCAGLDIRQTLFSLHRVFKKHLSTYASVLSRATPTRLGVGSAANADKTGTGASQQDRKKADFGTTLRRICAIVNTGEFCGSSMEQLEESLRQTVEEVYRSEIDLTKEREDFQSVCARGIGVLVSRVEEGVDKDLEGMWRREWPSCTEVGDASDYIEAMCERVTKTTLETHGMVGKTHFRFVLEKMARMVTEATQRAVYRCRKVCGVGAQQMLVDVTTVKGMLVGLPMTVQTGTGTTYVKLVKREMGRVEGVVKVLVGPMSSCVETYLALVGEAGHAEDLRKVLEIRGLTRAEAAPLVLEYARLGGRGLGEVTASDARTVRTETIGEGPGKGVERTGNGNGNGNGNGRLGDGGRKSLFGRLMESVESGGISDRIGQVSWQLAESTTDKLNNVTKETAAAAASLAGGAGRWSLFGAGNSNQTSRP